VILKTKPSWKNQSLISALNGLKELGDPRGFDVALAALSDSNAPHWTLATPTWDHRLAAAETLVVLGKANEGYSVILNQLKKSLAENDINDIFYNALQIKTLADPRGSEVFTLLKEKFKNNDNAMASVNQLEAQFTNALKKN